MDIFLEDKLNEIRNIILIFFFGSSDNRKVKITTRCKSLLQGDWSRKWSENLKPSRLNLDKLLGKEVDMNFIFNCLIEELKIKSSINEYSYNFNLNRFFIFYKEFYET